MQRIRSYCAVVVTLVAYVLFGPASAACAGGGIDTGGLQRLLAESPESVFLLDVRTPREFASGRIPGSVLIPMNQVANKLGAIPRDRKVVVICASGARSGAVTQYLNANGFPDAVNYTGGVYDWGRQGLQLER